jgi:hypothetical protein
LFVCLSVCLSVCLIVYYEHFSFVCLFPLLTCLVPSPVRCRFAVDDRVWLIACKLSVNVNFEVFRNNDPSLSFFPFSFHLHSIYFFIYLFIYLNRFFFSFHVGISDTYFMIAILFLTPRRLMTASEQCAQCVARLSLSLQVYMALTVMLSCCYIILFKFRFVLS